jgi:hypothetical protein
MDFKTNIEKLKGSTNWTKWKKQVELLLRHGEVLDIVTRNRKLPDEPRAAATAEECSKYEKELKRFMKDDALAQLILVGNMDDANVELTSTCDSAANTWDKLLSVYEQSSGQRLDRLMESFFAVAEKEADEDIATHIAKLQRNFTELNDELKRVAKTILPDLLLMSRILSTLPPEYFEFKSVWESVAIEERTVNKLTERLRLIEMRLPPKQSTSSSAFVASKKKPVKKYDRKCYVCRKVGHLAKDCYKNKNKPKTEGDAFLCVEGVPEAELWLADSGASAHMTKRKEYFCTYEPFAVPKRVKIGNSDDILAHGQGTINVKMLINGKWERNHLTEVWFVPEIDRNLFSVGKTIDKGFYFKADKEGCQFLKENIVRLEGKRITGGLYALEMKVILPEIAAGVYIATSEENIQLWHERLCHQNKQHIKEVLNKHGIKVSTEEEFCDGCMLGKQHRRSFGSRPNRPTEAGALIHADVCGPMQEKSLGGSRYFLSFKDDFTKFRRVFFINSKNEVPGCLKTFLNEAKTAGHIVKEFLSDCGKEFKNADVDAILQARGVNVRESMPYSPQQNGAAERENRTLVESARSMIHAKDLPIKLWAEAVNTSVYILNKTGPSSVKGKSPYELWFGKEVLSINHLRIFGTECFVHIPKPKRKKWDRKSIRGILVGYSGEKDGYRVYSKEQNKILLSRDVIFKNERTIFVNSAQSSEDNCEQNMEVISKFEEKQTSENTEVTENLEGSESNTEHDDEVSDEDTGKEIRCLRDRSKLKKPVKFENYVLLAEHTEPETYQEAISSEESHKWLSAMQEEMDSLLKNKTWELVDLPPERKAIGSRWVFRVKLNTDGSIQRYKARLVAKGFSQKFGIDFSETFSPVVRWETIRTVLSVAAIKGMKLSQFDVKTAFLYGELSEEIYMVQPEGFNDGTKKVCKLYKSIYGLKQAPRCWNERFKRFSESCELYQSSSDPCLFYNEDNSLLLIVYVDDGIIIAKDEEIARQFLKKLETEFCVTVEAANHYLGMQIEYLDSNKIFIHQEAYCKKILKRFNMLESNPVGVPIEKGSITTVESASLSEDVPFREAIGSLMFLSIVTRPDISYVVGVLSQVLDKPKQQHWNLVKRTLRYLKGTPKCGILYSPDLVCNLQCFCDSDFAGDPLSRKSTSGMVFMNGGGAICWKSQRQKCIALSTTEAEFISASQASKEAVWLSNLLNELDSLSETPVLKIDNQSAIKLIRNPTFHNRTKHIDIRYKFIRDLCESNQLNVSYCSSDAQAADLLTKALPKARFEKLRELIGMINSM